MNRKKIDIYLNNLLKVRCFKDFCFNGLHIEGKKEINRIVTGVTASLDLFKIALNWNVDAIFVHHGFFWKNNIYNIVGWIKERVKILILNNVNLFAFHLPLDYHFIYGNNSQLGFLLNLMCDYHYRVNNIIWIGILSEHIMLDELIVKIKILLICNPFVIFGKKKKIKKIAWCSGNSYKYFNNVIDLGVDLYITGEISENVISLSKESGVTFIAAGHYSTECFGIKMLGNHLSKKFNLKHKFIDFNISI